MFDYQNGKTEESKAVNATQEAAWGSANVPLNSNLNQLISPLRRQRLLAMQNTYGNRVFQRFAHATPRQAIQRMEQEHAAPKTQIDTFVVKAIESRSDSDKYTRSTSKSNRYDFRYPHAAHLPESGGDPTKKSASEKQPSNGYFYHVTSYFNLAKIFDSGLNPAAGGGVGGSSFQSEDTEMGDASDEYAAEAKLADDLFTELQEAGFKF